MGKKKMTTIRIDEDLLKQAHELGLNVSKVCENALKEYIKRLQGFNPQKQELKKEVWCGGRDLNPGRHAPIGGLRQRILSPHGHLRFPFLPLEVDYLHVKEDFVSWLKSKGLSWETHVVKMLRYLDRFAKPIRDSMGLIALFNGLGDSQRRHLANAFRCLFNFYEAQGLAPKGWLDRLRANLPKVSSGVDLKIPSEKEIVKSLRLLMNVKRDRYFALYNLLLDSGLRLIEGVKVFNAFVEGKVEIEEHDGFCVIPLGYFRGTKVAYYCYVTKYTIELLKNAKKTLRYKKVMGIGKLGVISWKYLRKFANDTMTSEKLNIPESVADFIQGRVPKTIGAKHYMRLKRKANQFYPRYAEYITMLRQKAFN